MKPISLNILSALLLSFQFMGYEALADSRDQELLSRIEKESCVAGPDLDLELTLEPTYFCHAFSQAEAGRFLDSFCLSADESKNVYVVRSKSVLVEILYSRYPEGTSFDYYSKDNFAWDTIRRKKVYEDDETLELVDEKFTFLVSRVNYSVDKKNLTGRYYFDDFTVDMTCKLVQK